MKRSRREVPILIVTMIYTSVFGVVALRGANYEFLLYIAVICAIGALAFWKQPSVQFDATILWGLSLWGFLHVCGGLIPIGDGVLYGRILIPCVPRLNILRYDQVVHLFGFGVATLIAYHLLRPHLLAEARRGVGFWVLVVLMGCGFGALNEIIEFAAVLTMPQTGVGGYENTLLDLVFNLFGSILAVGLIRWRERRGARRMERS